MLISPTYSNDYRNWACCCSRIRDLFRKLDLYSAGKVTNMGEHYKIRSQGRSAYKDYCLTQCHRISRKLIRYFKLRDKIAAELDSPEKHLLQVEDMLNMIGCVIENSSRHAVQKSYYVLNECSADGSKINDLDAYDLLALGYGKQLC